MTMWRDRIGWEGPLFPSFPTRPRPSFRCRFLPILHLIFSGKRSHPSWIRARSRELTLVKVPLKRAQCLVLDASAFMTSPILSTYLFFESYFLFPALITCEQDHPPPTKRNRTFSSSSTCSWFLQESKQYVLFSFSFLRTVSRKHVRKELRFAFVGVELILVTYLDNIVFLLFSQ